MNIDLNDLKNDIPGESERWKDSAFIFELEKEFKSWNSGNEKGYSLADINLEIAAREAMKRDRHFQI
jgi:hypothetical protein